MVLIDCLGVFSADIACLVLFCEEGEYAAVSIPEHNHVVCRNVESMSNMRVNQPYVRYKTQRTKLSSSSSSGEIDGHCSIHHHCVAKV